MGKGNTCINVKLSSSQLKLIIHPKRSIKMCNFLFIFMSSQLVWLVWFLLWSLLIDKMCFVHTMQSMVTKIVCLPTVQHTNNLFWVRKQFWWTVPLTRSVLDKSMLIEDKRLKRRATQSSSAHLGQDFFSSLIKLRGGYETVSNWKWLLV